jgi:hypothetical protein
MQLLETMSVSHAQLCNFGVAPPSFLTVQDDAATQHLALPSLGSWRYAPASTAPIASRALLILSVSSRLRSRLTCVFGKVTAAARKIQ